MGIRLALGSSRPGLLRLIVMQAMRLILAGGVVGIAGSWFLDCLLASLLVGVKVHDPVSLSLVWALKTLIALLGSSLPARNSARTDPMSVLCAREAVAIPQTIATSKAPRIVPAADRKISNISAIPLADFASLLPVERLLNG